MFQQFHDEEEADEPLAPLPDADEVEVIDGDEEDDNAVAKEEPTPAPEAVLVETQEVDEPKVEPEEEPSTQLTLQSTEADMEERNDLDPSAGLDPIVGLEPDDVTMDVNMDDVDSGLKMTDETGMEIDMSSFGPDGLGLEGTDDLSQMEPTDAILGGAMMDETADPFAAAANPIDPQ